MLREVKADRMKCKIEQYAGTTALLADLNSRQMKKGGWHEPQFSSWSGIASREELNRMLREGYEAPVQRLKEKVKVQATGSGKRITFKNDIVGANPIVPLAMMGVPTSMINMNMKPIKNKVLDIYYDMTCHCGIKASQIEDAGEKVLGAILEMEAQGYRFNLYSVNSYADYGDCDILAVKVKDANHPFDLKRMSFSLMHPAFFRVVGFDWYSKCPTSVYKPAYGRALGQEVGTIRAQEIYKQVFGKNAIFFQASEIVKGMDQEHIKEVLQNAGNDIQK